MLRLDIQVPQNLQSVIARLLRYDKIADKHLVSAMNDSVAKIEKPAIKGAPVGVSSRLRKSIGSTVTETRSAIIGRVGSSLRKEIYPRVMETGRRFGRKRPPISALVRWVELKLRVPKKRARGVAFLVARKIGSRGIVGRFFMRKAFTKSRKFVQRRFRKALKEIAKEIKG
jgi:hypothetical protein